MKTASADKRRGPRRARKSRLTISRSGLVSDWNASAFVYVDKRRGHSERRNLLSVVLIGALCSRFETSSPSS